MLLAATIAINSYYQVIPSTGSIVAINIGVYQDSNCSQVLNSIPWGILTPNQTKTFTCYVKNLGATQARLSMFTSAWDPSNASSYILLTWNRIDYLLNATLSVLATLTLKIFPNITGITTFKMNVTILGDV